MVRIEQSAPASRTVSSSCPSLAVRSARRGSVMLDFTTNEAGGVLIIAFEPTDEINYDWQSTQRDWLYKLIESREDPRFAVDLNEVNYLASSEIGFLVTRKGRSSSSASAPIFMTSSGR